MSPLPRTGGAVEVRRTSAAERPLSIEPSVAEPICPRSEVERSRPRASDRSKYTCPVRVYLDLCCLNRPFDDQRQIRIRLESEAVLAVLHRAARGDIVWLSSEAIELEASRNSDAVRLDRVLLIASHATESLPLTEDDFDRAVHLESIGFGAFDALHLACAERGRASTFLTTDDRLLKLAGRNRDSLQLAVRNPLEWVREAFT
jgi:predicted nucleic acid-binding protein